MLNIPLIRCLNQQLVSPQFKSPEEVVAWMGAMQAQDFAAAMRALAMRMRRPTEDAIIKALNEGKIVRTHVMRPTWQFVSGKDLRWMLRLSEKKNVRALLGYMKMGGETVTDAELDDAMTCIVQLLKGGKSLLQDDFKVAFPGASTRRMKDYIELAEMRGLICSGYYNNRKNTYMLIDEHVPAVPELTKDEALAQFATNYFQSHSPATIDDFVWWSGLNMSEARSAIEAIHDHLSETVVKGATYYVHDSCRLRGRLKGVHLILPAFDEYLLGYRDRSAVLPAHLVREISTINGIFFHAEMHEGQIIGRYRGSL